MAKSIPTIAATSTLAMVRTASARGAEVADLLREGQATGFFRDDVDPDTHARLALLLTLGYFAVHPVTGDETDYVSPTDYSITGRNLVWVLGRGPGVGRNYSVVYAVKSFDWMVFTMPMQRFERARNLGTKVLLRRRHSVSKVPF